MSDIYGIVNVIKPPGMSSFQVVSTVRRLLEVSKAGHTGTLDPAATGVLPVCVGRATKIIPFLPEGKKEYIAEITLGITTDTLDAEGEILEKKYNWQELTLEKVTTVLKEFTGKIEQLPPMYSAVHHQGKRLYELARNGEEVEREPREVIIDQLELLGINLPIIRIRVVCSKGTYIRSLAADIGEKLKTGAFLSFLVRSKSGPFYIKDGFTLEEIGEKMEKVVLSPDKFLEFPEVTVKSESEQKARNGTSLDKDDLLCYPDKLLPGQYIILYGSNKSFISINEVINLHEDNFKINPVRVFNF